MDADFEEIITRSHALAPVDGETLARLEARLEEMGRELETRTSRVEERQASLNALQSSLDRSRRESLELARDIARGEDALARMRVRASLQLQPPISLAFVEDGEAQESRAA